MTESKGGIELGIGNVMAAIISYSAWHSIGWALLHALFGWFYVIYYVIIYGIGKD